MAYMNVTRPELELRRQMPHTFIRTAQALCGSDDTCDFIIDGAADEVEVNAMITYLNGLGGGEGRLMGETFTQTATIDMDSNFIVLTASGWSTILDGDAAGAHCITVTGNNCVLRGFECRTAQGGTNPYDAINTIGTDLLVDYVFINGSDRYGVYVDAARGKIVNCYIFDIDDMGVYIEDDGDWTIINSNVINTTGDDGIYIDTDGDNCSINGNIITGWTGEAIDDDSGTASIGDDNWAGAGTYETQTGIIAAPTVTAGGSWQGRTIEAFNSDEDRYFSWTYQDGAYRGVELLG